MAKEKTPEEIALDKAKEGAQKAFAAATAGVGGGPFAARVTDPHLCPLVDGLKPHVGGPILPPGCPTVMIGGMIAARVGDMATCASAPDVIAMGSTTVLIGGMMAARMGDPTAHGGMIVMGCPTVMIGIPGQGSVLQQAAMTGVPFCEECAKAAALAAAGGRRMTPTAVVEVLSGGRAGDRAEAAPGRPVRVGRAKPAELVVADDPLLSAAHFAVECGDGGCRVKDLGSRFGTLLRGGWITDAEVRDGDEITAGRTTFGVRLTGVGAAATVALPTVVAQAPAVFEAAPPPTAVVPAGRDGVRAWLAAQRDLYAILDAAREPSIPDRLAKSGEEHASLYDGEKGKALAPYGPWLVRLPPGSKLLDELVAEGWGNSWGVYLTCDKPLAEVRRHLRQFLMAKLPDGERAYFRYYDPRVLRTYLPTCKPDEVAAFLGPIRGYFAEPPDGSGALAFVAGGAGWRAVK